MGQLGGWMCPLQGGADNDRRDTGRNGQGQIGGSVLSRTIAGKVVEERLTETGLGTLAGGRRVLVPCGGSSHFRRRGITFFPSLALGLEGSPLSQAQAKDVSSVSHPSPSISSSQGRRPQKKEMGRSRGKGAKPVNSEDLGQGTSSGPGVSSGRGA